MSKVERQALARARRQMARRFLSSGVTRVVAIDMLVKQFGCTRSTAEATLTKVSSAMQRDYETDKQYLKSRQIERLHQHVTKAAQHASKTGKGWSGVASLEDKIARIYGGYEPLRVEVDAGVVAVEALGRWLSQLTPEEVAKIEAEQREVEALADVGRVVQAPKLNGHSGNGVPKP